MPSSKWKEGERERQRQRERETLFGNNVQATGHFFARDAQRKLSKALQARHCSLSEESEYVYPSPCAHSRECHVGCVAIFTPTFRRTSIVPSMARAASNECRQCSPCVHYPLAGIARHACFGTRGPFAVPSPHVRGCADQRLSNPHPPHKITTQPARHLHPFIYPQVLTHPLV